MNKTRRERLKSALYLRLRKRKTLFSKKTNIHSVAKYQISKKLKGDHLEEKKLEKKSHNTEKLKGGPFGVFKHPICCKTSKKLTGDPLEKKKLEKKSHNAEKLKGEPFEVFSTSILSQNMKKLKKKNFISGKKSHNAEKN